MRSYTKKESEIRIIPEEKGVTSGFNIVNAKALTDESAEIEIAGITFINELSDTGLNGMETEKERWKSLIGVTGGWYNFGISEVIENIQVMKSNDTSGGGLAYRTKDFLPHVYYASIYSKVEEVAFHTESEAGQLCAKSSSSNTINSVNPIVKGIWERISILVDATSYESIFFQIRSGKPLNSGEYVQSAYRSFQIIDLTIMGIIPPPIFHYLKNKYSIACNKWDQLTKEILDEIIPDYIKSIQTTGYKLIDELIVGISNKQKNILNLENFPAFNVKYAEGTISGANGDFWVNGTGLWRDNGVECYYNDLGEVIRKGQRMWSVPINVKRNTDYTLSAKQKVIGSRGHYTVNIYKNLIHSDILNSDKLTHRFTNGICEWHFNSGDTDRITIYIDFYNSHGFLYDFQLEEGIIATLYKQPYKYSNHISELWSWNGCSDTNKNKNFKRVILNEAILADGSIDWSWYKGISVDCIVWNIQKESPHYAENLVLKTGNEVSTGWLECDNIMVVFNNIGSEVNNTIETYTHKPALEFVSTDKQYVDTLYGNGINPFTNKLEIKIKCRPTMFGKWILFGSQTTNNRIYIGSEFGNLWSFGIQNRPWQNSENLPVILNKIVDIKILFDSGIAQLFVDEVLASTMAYTSFTTGENFFLGTHNDTGTPSYYFNGEIYSYELYLNDTLKQNLNFIEGTGNTLIDHSGNENHGTIHGATWTKGLVSKLSEVKELPKTPKKMILSKGHNNIICDSAFISITHTKESDTSELLGFAEGFKATDSKNYYEYQPVSFKTKKRIETSRGYKITIDDLYLDASWDKRFEEGSFTIEVKDINEDEDKTIITKYHGCQIDSLSRDEGEYIKRGVEITAQSKEVIEE
ncbi:MAG TPA: hypothetical protein PLO84_10765 [Thermotogota bacterium]|nr:hypothetical protein [Thermotogota bacterium]